MARYAGSQGKGPKKTKRDKLKASVHIEKPSGNPKSQRTRIMRYNDGDPKVYGEKLPNGMTSARGRYSKAAANPNLLRNESVGKTKSHSGNTKKTEKQYPRPKKKKK